jgi:hypothetical protein
MDNSNKFKNLLGGLRPPQNNGDDSSSEDEQVTRYEGRKASMHQVNVVGMNFEKYNDLKPNNDLKLKIQNFFMEYHEAQDKEHAIEEFKDIVELT